MSKMVLIADDDNMMRMMLDIMLRRSNKEINTILAANGEEALRAAETLKPDMAIVDVVMPVMGGEELSKKLRQLYPKLPIIIVTGFENETVKQRLIKNVKVDEYLQKPLDFKRFSAEIGKLMK